MPNYKGGKCCNYNYDNDKIFVQYPELTIIQFNLIEYDDELQIKFELKKVI